MAELIPLEYRITLMRRKYVRRWGIAAILAAIIAGSSLVQVHHWQQLQARAAARLDNEYREKSVLIKQARDLQAKRLDLAARMEKLQALRDDKVLLSLLKNVASGFSDNDCLQYVSITAHSNQPEKQDAPKYVVHLLGATATYLTHANLLDRLTDIGAKSDPPMSLPPDSTRIEKMLDGEVIHFEIVCEQPGAKGA